MPLLGWSARLTIYAGVFSIFANMERIYSVLARFKSVFTLSFFIYAMHPQGLIVHIPLEWVGAPFAVVYLSRIVCGIAVPIAIGLFLRRFAPRVLAVLTGGRGLAASG